MNDWQYRLAEHRGTLTAVAIFVVMFIIYTANHPAGFTANVIHTAANKGCCSPLSRWPKPWW